MATGEKRCLYEVLGISRECTADEIRSAYRKLALQRHPDKLVKSGLSTAEATAAFQELVNAYEVLSDPRERAWYDSHRSQILFSGSDRSGSGSAVVPDLFSFFSKSVFCGYSDSGKGFFKVYNDVFDKIYSNELNFAKKMGLGVEAVKEAPLMGKLESPYAQVTAFYNYWLGFATVMDFCWTDQFDAMAGPNRKSRRVMEEENKKIRKKARREYNDTVRSLAEFVKKRDKRVIDMQLKKNEEMEKKRKEEQRRKKEMEREKLERARAYKEPEWSKVEDDGEFEEEDNEIEIEKKDSANELFCVVCRKKFKSEKQWKNHEQSKKHKEKVAELREAFSQEDEREEEVGEGEDGEIDELSENFDDNLKFQEQDNDDEKAAQSSEEEAAFDENLKFQEQVNDDGKAAQSSEEEAYFDEKKIDPTKLNESVVSNDDEESILEAMVSRRTSRKYANLPKAKISTAKTNLKNESDDNDLDFMEYNNLKSTRRRRAAKGDRGKTSEIEVKSEAGEINLCENDDLRNDETKAHASVENEKGVEDGHQSGKINISKQTVNKKGSDKKETLSKSKSSSKGKKHKATSKSSSNVCDTCGMDFESRSKLFKHLGDSGHATLKSR